MNPVIPPAPAVTQMSTQQFLDLGKVPDVVRDLKTFHGDPTRLVDWLSDAESLLDTYKKNGATAVQLSVLERIIRRKVEGEAADVLNANNIYFDWEGIKSTLILYYKDQRDIKTLDFQLTSIKKSDETLNTYYSRVNELLSLIISQIQTDPKMKLNAAVHVDYFRDKALDAFIRGLDKPLSILLKSTKPQSLGQAYNFCVEYLNMDIRSAPYRNEFGGQSTPKPRDPPRVPVRTHIPQPRLFAPPPLPPRRPPINHFYNPAPPPRPFQPNPFRPTSQNNPFNSNPQNTQFRPNPFRNNPFANPEPMEVDTSQQTRHLNYGNRPAMNLKRPHPPSQQYQTFKRQAHPLESMYPQYEDYDYGYTDGYDYGYVDEQYGNETPYDYSYEQPIQPIHKETGEPSEITPQTTSNSQSNEANFLEWLPRW